MKAVLAVLLLAAVAARAADRPNVILVLTDDQGYEEMACHGNPVLETPAIDRLYGDSTRFTQFFVSPLCQPTRASLMSGRNKVIGRRIELSEQTLPELFKRAGYGTAIFGKWHLGEYPPFRPVDRGFDHQLLIGGGAIGQVQDYWGNTNFDTWFRDSAGEWVATEGYCTDVLVDRAIGWIDRQAAAGTPFFCYLSLNAAHSPFGAPERFEQPYLDRGMGATAAAYYGMIGNIDWNLGRLRQHLAEAGIERETLLVFLTDNGSVMTPGSFERRLRGGKTSIYEGGSRAAAFFCWPGRLEAGREIDQLAMHYDLLPTFSELLGVPLLEGPETAPVEGISLAATLLGEEPSYPERHYIVYQGFWPPDQPLRRYKNTSVRSQDFRLANGDELYHLRTDPTERDNVIADYPEKAAELRAAHDRWWDRMADELPQLRVYKPYPVGGPGGHPATLTALHYYDSLVYPEAQKWFESKFYLQSAYRALLEDEASADPRMTPLLGSWKIDFRAPGAYRFELRKNPGTAPPELTAIRPGKACLLIDGRRIEVPVEGGLQSVSLDAVVKEPGVRRIECWFEGQRADGKPSGAYYATIHPAAAAPRPSNTP